MFSLVDGFFYFPKFPQNWGWGGFVAIFEIESNGGWWAHIYTNIMTVTAFFRLGWLRLGCNNSSLFRIQNYFYS